MTKVQSSKFEVDKLNGKNNFELWKLKIQNFLVQQGLQNVDFNLVKYLLQTYF
jgi:hypothetical protein